MKTNLILAAALALTALAMVPPAQASDLAAPCQTAQMSGCCPMGGAFAPCCTLVNCPPPVLRCPQQSTDPVMAALSFGDVPVPVVSAETNSDCSADLCVNEHGEPCTEENCEEHDADCCTVDGASYSCTCEEASVGTSDFFAYMGPHAGVLVSEGCRASVWHDRLPIECTCDPLPIEFN